MEPALLGFPDLIAHLAVERFPCAADIGRQVHQHGDLVPFRRQVRENRLAVPHRHVRQAQACGDLRGPIEQRPRRVVVDREHTAVVDKRQRDREVPKERGAEQHQRQDADDAALCPSDEIRRLSPNAFEAVRQALVIPAGRRLRLDKGVPLAGVRIGSHTDGQILRVAGYHAATNSTGNDGSVPAAASNRTSETVENAKSRTSARSRGSVRARFR